MINVGVVGFGNLGRAVAKQIAHNKEFNLVAVFSRRDIENTISYDTILDYKERIDLLFLCGGSKNDIEQQSSFLIQHFNIIDCYDNHSQLQEHIENINQLAKSNKKVALCALGWDPGLFSLMRGLFDALGHTPYTFWGRGTSQGHTQAIKQIKGVKDALQFTIPNTHAISKIKHGKNVGTQNSHFRKCFIVANKKDEKQIRNEIINMPHYFKGYKTSVKFVSKKQLQKLKSFSHKGEIVSAKNILNFSLNIKSNPDFTAKIMILFAKSLNFFHKNCNYGAKTIFDIPFRCILNKDLFCFL